MGNMLSLWQLIPLLRKRACTVLIRTILASYSLGSLIYNQNGSSPLNASLALRAVHVLPGVDPRHKSCADAADGEPGKELARAALGRQQMFQWHGRVLRRILLGSDIFLPQNEAVIKLELFGQGITPSQQKILNQRTLRKLPIAFCRV